MFLVVSVVRVHLPFSFVPLFYYLLSIIVSFKEEDGEEFSGEYVFIQFPYQMNSRFVSL